MKKLFCLAALLSVGFVGCAPSETKTESTPAAPAANMAPKDAPVAAPADAAPAAETPVAPAAEAPAAEAPAAEAPK